MILYQGGAVDCGLKDESASRDFWSLSSGAIQAAALRGEQPTANTQM